MSLNTTQVAVGVAALALLAILAIWLVPRLQARRWRATGLPPKEVAELENGSRGTLVQVFGGAALILTFVATWVQIGDARDASERTLELTQAQQQADRFGRAVEQLGSERLEIRLGGIYALQQVATESSRLQQPVAELMMAYLKRNRPVRPRGNAERFVRVRIANLISLMRGRQGGAVGACETRFVAPEPDTQAAVSALMSVPRDARGNFDLSGVDLAGVRLVEPDFSGVEMRRSLLVDADLVGANFEEARLDDSDLRRVCLRGADMSGAHLHAARTGGADLRGADMTDFVSEGYPSWLSGALTDDCKHVRKGSPAREMCQEP